MEDLAQMIANLIGADLVYGYLIVGILIGVIVGAILVRPRGGRSRGEIGGGIRARSASTMTKLEMRSTPSSSFELEINGQKIDVKPEVIAEVRRLSGENRKVEAIKVLREATGLGLAESKNLVEMMERTASLRT